MTRDEYENREWLESFRMNALRDLYIEDSDGGYIIGGLEKDKDGQFIAWYEPQNGSRITQTFDDYFMAKDWVEQRAYSEIL